MNGSVGTTRWWCESKTGESGIRQMNGYQIFKMEHAHSLVSRNL